MLLMIDNYDSFTYNLVQYLQVLEENVKVVRNDELTVDEALGLSPDAIVISPGPGRPCDAGTSIPLIKAASGKLPVLGVCLGHQAIGEAFGGVIIKASRIMHGKVSEIEHNGEGIFAGIRSPLKATRYHSLMIDEATMPDCLEVTARADDGDIMGVRHKEHQIVGVQFHPESILTPCGKRLLGNFLKLGKE